MNDLRALLEKATPGPWMARCRDSGNPTNDPSWTGLYGFLGWEIDPLEVPSRGAIESGWDAALIVALRNHAEALLDCADALRFHNKTPNGATRKCLPGCIACAALDRLEDPR